MSRIPTVLTVLFATCSCAYHAGVGDRKLPGGYRTVAVPMFKNNSYESGIEVYLTNAMVRELERLRIGTLANKSDAQATLLGTVDSVTYTPANTTLIDHDHYPRGPENSKINNQYLITLKVSLKLVRNADQKAIWEGTFTRDQSYNTPQLLQELGLTSANALYNHSARYQTIEGMANDLMSEAHDRLTENF